jgi:glutaconate CoA-transferase, subunit B
VGRTIIFMQQEKRKFVPQLDYLTCPGYLDGPRGRAQAGLPDGGPAVVITNMAVFRFDESSRRMYLDGCYPGVTPDQVLERMGFAVEVDRVRPVQPPTPHELDILRSQCDPQRLILQD